MGAKPMEKSDQSFLLLLTCLPNLSVKLAQLSSRVRSVFNI